MFTMFDPKTSPNASSGSSIRTAVMLLESSGREVARATRMLPTKRRPQPVSVASASPYLASWPPRKMTANALPRKTRTAGIKPTSASGFSILTGCSRTGGDGLDDAAAHLDGGNPLGARGSDVRGAAALVQDRFHR